jgi:phosphoglycerate dehydrogenase-like enzyme
VPVTRKSVVRTDLWLHPSFEENLARESDIDLTVCSIKASAADARPLLAGAHAFHVSPAKDELPAHLFITPTMLSTCPNLLVVSSAGAGFDTIDVDACTAAGVAVVNQAGGNKEAVAEHALAMMLMLARQLHRINGLISAEQLRAAGYMPAVGAHAFDKRVPGSAWGRGTSLGILRDSTLGIVGCGEIGRELALRAAVFGMRVVYTQRHPLAPEDERKFNVRYLTLDELLTTSDWVSLHVPESDLTRGMIGGRQFALMKKGARLINVSRASLIERNSLIDALESGRLSGFALDAQYAEPGSATDRLLDFPQVILTPHTAGQPRAIGLADFRDVMINIARALAA